MTGTPFDRGGASPATGVDGRRWPTAATLAADILLVAVGRGPVSTEGLGYAEAGVELDRGFVLVDERLQTIRARGLRGR